MSLLKVVLFVSLLTYSFSWAGTEGGGGGWVTTVSYSPNIMEDNNLSEGMNPSAIKLHGIFPNELIVFSIDGEVNTAFEDDIRNFDNSLLEKLGNQLNNCKLTDEIVICN